MIPDRPTPLTPEAALEQLDQADKDLTAAQGHANRVLRFGLGEVVDGIGDPTTALAVAQAATAVAWANLGRLFVSVVQLAVEDKL